jgi:hypothetical protein
VNFTPLFKTPLPQLLSSSKAKMATKKDMRREDLSKIWLFPRQEAYDWLHIVIPYQKPAAKEGSSDFTSTMGSTLPMAAIFTRNKYIGW